MSRKLSLVGTILTDPNGESKLVRAINQLNPTTLTLQEPEGYAELTPDFINKVAAFLRGDERLREWGFDQEKIDAVARDLRQYGFERRVAYLTQMTKPVKVHLLGVDAPTEAVEYDKEISGAIQSVMPDISREYKQIVDSIYLHLVKNRNLPRNKQTAFMAQYVASSFFTEEERDSIVKHQYEEPIIVPGPDVMRRWETGDQAIEARIRSLWNQTQEDFMHVGGIASIFGQYNNLFERLGDLSPVRYRLNEFK